MSTLSLCVSRAPAGLDSRLTHSYTGLLWPLRALLGYARDVRSLHIVFKVASSALTVSSSIRSGMMIGLSTYTTKHHIARATLEATCFQTRAILEAMSKDVALSAAAGGGKPKPDGNGERADGVKGEDDQGEDPAEIRVLQVDGGMTGSDVTMQLQADILGIDVRRPLMREWVPSALLAPCASPN